MSSSPLVNSVVKNRLFKTAPDIDEPPFQFIHTMDLSVVDTMLYDINPQLSTRNPQNWDLGCLKATGWTQKSLAFLDAAVQLLHVRSAVCWCTVLLEQSCYQTLCVSLAAVWRHEAASKKSVRDITRISYFVATMKLLHALQIYSTVFVKRCMQLHFSR